MAQRRPFSGGGGSGTGAEDDYSVCENVKLGNPCHISGENSMAKAYADSTAKHKFAGVAKEDISPGETGKFITDGLAEDALTDATPSADIFLGINGEYVEAAPTRPSAGSKWTVPVGTAKNAADLLVQKEAATQPFEYVADIAYEVSFQRTGHSLAGCGLMGGASDWDLSGGDFAPSVYVADSLTPASYALAGSGLLPLANEATPFTTDGLGIAWRGGQHLVASNASIGNPASSYAGLAFRFAGRVPSGEEVILDKFDTATTRGWQWKFNSSNQMEVRLATSAGDVSHVSDALVPGTWIYMVVIIQVGSSGADHFRFYLGGNTHYSGSATVSAPGGSASYSNTVPIRVGADQNGANQLTVPTALIAAYVAVPFAAADPQSELYALTSTRRVHGFHPEVASDYTAPRSGAPENGKGWYRDGEQYCEMYYDSGPHAGKVKFFRLGANFPCVERYKTPAGEIVIGFGSESGWEKNAALYGRDLTNAAWTKLVGADTRTLGEPGPGDGQCDTGTMTTLVADNTTTQHGFSQDIAQAGTFNACQWCVVKKGAADWFYFDLDADKWGYFDLSTGVIGSSGSQVIELSIEDLGDDTYLCAMRMTVTTATTNTCQFLAADSDGAFDPTYSGGDGSTATFHVGYMQQGQTDIDRSNGHRARYIETEGSIASQAVSWFTHRNYTTKNWDITSAFAVLMDYCSKDRFATAFGWRGIYWCDNSVAGREFALVGAGAPVIWVQNPGQDWIETLNDDLNDGEPHFIWTAMALNDGEFWQDGVSIGADSSVDLPTVGASFFEGPSSAPLLGNSQWAANAGNHGLASGFVILNVRREPA